MICKRLKSCIGEAFEQKENGDCTEENSDCTIDDKNKCRQSSDQRRFVRCEERGKKYILENTLKNLVVSYKMDGGIIVVDKWVPEGISKCDYLYCINGEETSAILIELKGLNVSKALKQIRETMNNFRDTLKDFSHIYGRIIVTSSTPNLKANPDYVAVVKMLRKYNGNLKIESREYTEKDIALPSEK